MGDHLCPDCHGAVARPALLAGLPACALCRPMKGRRGSGLAAINARRSLALHIIIPFVDTMRKVDMREQVVDVQPQEVITKDNVVVTVDAIVFITVRRPTR